LLFVNVENDVCREIASLIYTDGKYVRLLRRNSPGAERQCRVSSNGENTGQRIS